MANDAPAAGAIMPFDPNFGTSSDEDLLAMGRQAGYLPAEDTIAPETQPPMREGLAPPGYQLQSPEQSPVVPTSAPQPGGVGVGTSYRGFSGDAFNRVSKTQGGLDADMARADQEAAAGANRNAEIAQTGAASGIDAAKAEATALSNKATAGGEQALVMQRLQDGFAAEEAKINASATAQSNQSKADYLNALMDFRAAKVDPAQLWKNMGTGTQIGMMATAFVHDFLGVKGIHTSAMDTFNKAVDRNIDSQIQAIKTKGEVAEGFKSLWYMQRNQSASDTEARTRVRGFLLEGAKQQIISNMAQYESALASAQGKAAIAKIDEELSKNLIEVYQHADGNALQLRNQALEKWKTKVNASLEQQSLNLRANELAMKKAEKQTDPLAHYMADITPSGGGKLRYEIHTAQPQKEDEVREQMGHLANFDNTVGQFQALARKVGSMPIEAGARMHSEDGRRLINMRDQMAYNLAYAKSGKQTTAAEIDHFKEMFPLDTWFTNGVTDKVIAETNELAREEAFGNMAPFVREVGENETITGQDGKTYRLRDIQLNPSFGKPGELPAGAPGQAQGTNNRDIINPPAPSEEEKLRTEADKLLAAAPGKEDISGDSDSLTEGLPGVKHEFLQKHPEFNKTTQPTGEQLQNKLDNKPDRDPISAHDKGLLMLARLAEGGDKKSMEQLRVQANSWIIGRDENDADGAFAAYLMEMVQPGSTDTNNEP